MYVADFFCDLTKAFNCVNHALLLHKLQFNGVGGVILDWFKNRIYSVKNRDELKLANSLSYSSGWKPGNCGGPPGYGFRFLTF